MGLAYSTGSFYNAKPDHGIFGAYALTKSESTVKVASRIEEIIREMRGKTVPPKELERSTRSIKNSFIFSFTSAEKIAFQKLMIEYEGLPEDYLETYSRKIEEVNSNDIQNEAVQWLVPDRAVRLIVGNEKVYKDIVHHYGSATRMDPTF
jgi:zinc protease